MLRMQKERVEKAYNKRVKIKAFSTRDFVWKVNLPMDLKNRILGKWSPNWEGPSQVTNFFYIMPTRLRS